MIHTPTDLPVSGLCCTGLAWSGLTSTEVSWCKPIGTDPAWVGLGWTELDLFDLPQASQKGRPDVILRAPIDWWGQQIFYTLP